DLYKIGKDVIQGLINGISSMASAAWEAAKGVASSVKDAVTGFLGIHSPSRVMRDIGHYIGQGLIKGLNHMIHPAVKVAQDMASAVKDSFSVLNDNIQ
ncbi:tail length tape measure protein, partial [Acinetobacter baumannii]|nr:tail length tape measure protein [Acinetobacter baumannii]